MRTWIIRLSIATFIGLAALALAGLAAILVARAAGVELLELRPAGAGFRHLDLARIALRYDSQGTVATATADRLAVDWAWQGWQPRLRQVTAASLHLDIGAIGDGGDTAPVEPGKPFEPPAWLPASIALDQVIVDYPCVASRCRADGKLSLTFGGKEAGLRSNWAMTPAFPAERLDIAAAFLPELDRVSGTLVLTRPVLPTAAASYGVAADHFVVALTAGSVSRAAAAPIPLQLAWHTTGASLLEGEAEMQLSAAESRADIATAHLALALPQLSLPGDVLLRDIAGEIRLAGTASPAAVALQIESAHLATALVMSGVALEQAQVALGGGEFTLDPASGDLRWRQQVTGAVLAGKLDVAGAALAADEMTLGATDVDASLRQGHWQAAAAVADVRLAGAATYNDTRLDQADLVLTGLDLSVGADGQWRLALPRGQLAGKATGAGLQAQDLQLALAEVTAARSPEGLTFTAGSELTAPRLQHPALKPQAWSWRATWQGSKDTVTGSGELSGSAGLAVNHTLHWQSPLLNADWKLQDIFLRAGNPLAATLADWPELASLSSGKVQAHGTAQWASDGSKPLRAGAEISLSGLNGIYNTTQATGIDGNFTVALDDNQLRLATTDMSVQEINPGMRLGPLAAAFDYRAALDAPLAGELALDSLRLQAFGGLVSLPATRWRPGEALATQVEIQSLQLASLLEQYPAAELKGTGTINGALPLRYTADGITVQSGSVSADPAGGVIQYRPAGAESLGKTNQGMALVLDALRDFHYSTLAADVSYDPSGKLVLGLRLYGSNPELEQGRAVNLNVTVEEDLPALFTSLQLSDRVSDVIRKRVEQRLRRKSLSQP